MKFLILPGSLRKESFNKKLGREVHRELERLQHDVIFTDLKDHPFPIFDEDVEREHFPESINLISGQILAADGVVICSPEYNGSISSPLKSVIDWTSRTKPNCWEAKPVLMLGASPGAFGAVRGLWHGRQPLEKLNAYVYPEMFELGKAHEAFEADGRFKDPKNLERMKKLAEKFIAYVDKFKN